MNDRPLEGLSDEERKTADSMDYTELESQADTARDQHQHALAADLYLLASEKNPSAIQRGLLRRNHLAAASAHNNSK